MRALLATLLFACACGGSSFAAPPAAAAPFPEPLAAKQARLPRIADLPCFDCHALGEWKDGARFPHAGESHQGLGHCHRCHGGGGHHGPMTIDRASCAECH